MPKTRLEWADWVGAITGIIGASLIASNIGMQGLAFCVFTFSVLCFIYVAKIKDIKGMLVMNMIFLVINIWGIWRWIFAPVGL